jgi:hypothetical protein
VECARVLDELVKSSPRLPVFGPRDNFSRLDARLREDERLHEVVPDICTASLEMWTGHFSFVTSFSK